MYTAQSKLLLTLTTYTVSQLITRYSALREEAEEQRHLNQVESEFESKADLFSTGGQRSTANRMRNLHLFNTDVILDVKCEDIAHFFFTLPFYNYFYFTYRAVV